MDENTKQIVAAILTASYYAAKGGQPAPSSMVGHYCDVLTALSEAETEIAEASAPDFVGVPPVSGGADDND